MPASTTMALRSAPLASPVILAISIRSTSGSFLILSAWICRILSLPSADGHGYLDDSVKASRPQQSRIEDIYPVGRSYYLDVTACPETVHLSQKLHHRPVDLGAASGTIVGSDAAYGVDLIDEYDAWGLLASHLEDVANELCSFANELVDQL